MDIITLGHVPVASEQPTLTIEAVAAILGISRSSAYAAAQSGDIPVLAIGRRLLVPTAALRRMLQLDEPHDAT